MKLNVGASPIWDCEGWTTLDHKFRENHFDGWELMRE